MMSLLGVPLTEGARICNKPLRDFPPCPHCGRKILEHTLTFWTNPRLAARERIPFGIRFMCGDEWSTKFYPTKSYPV
jgi:hypothetical protein